MGLVSTAPRVRPVSSRRRTARCRSAARVVAGVHPVRGLRQFRPHMRLEMWPCRMVRSGPWTVGVSPAQGASLRAGLSSSGNRPWVEW